MGAIRFSIAIGLFCAYLVNAQTTCSTGEGTACIFGDYCSTIEASCISGYCRCFGSQTLDPCTCLPTIGSCHIEVNASSRVGGATYRGSLQTPTYSCTANDNCNYDVHVIGSYYARVRYRQITSASVYLNVQGQSSKPLIVVLLSYVPVRWSLRVPSGVVIDTVIVGGFYVTRSLVSFPPGKVLAVEKPSRQLLPFSYGSNNRNTIRVLQYVANRFGPVASFTGTEQATSWTLNINRRSADSGCVSVTAPPTVSTPLFTTTAVPANCTEAQTRLGGCLVQEGSSNSVGTPSSYSGSNTPTTYSCVTDCTGGQYEVHVIGMYDAVVFQNNVNVQMTVCGHSSKRLVLVLISQRELQWVVDVPRGVFIHRILVSSFYTDRTNVSHTPLRVGTVEKTGYGYLPYGYGRDLSEGSTAESLQYLINRFGSIASFSGAYSAKKWVLDIQRENGSSSCMTSVTTSVPPTPGMTSATDPTLTTGPTTSLPATPATPRFTGTGVNIGATVGIVFGVLAASMVLAFAVAVCIKFCTRGNTPVATHVPPRSQDIITHSYRSALQQQHTIVNSQASLGSGTLHPMVPLESELQNVPPPAYSAAHHYPVYSPVNREKYEGRDLDGLNVPNQNTSPSKEPTQEPPPPYPGSAVPA